MVIVELSSGMANIFGVEEVVKFTELERTFVFAPIVAPTVQTMELSPTSILSQVSGDFFDPRIDLGEICPLMSDHQRQDDAFEMLWASHIGAAVPSPSDPFAEPDAGMDSESAGDYEPAQQGLWHLRIE